MYKVNKDTTTGIILIEDSFSLSGTGSSAPPTFNQIDEEYIITFTDLTNVEKFKTFTLEYTGKTNDRYLKSEYRISRDFIKWTQWYDLPNSIKEFPPFNSSDTMYFDLRLTRKVTSTIGSKKV